MQLEQTRPHAGPLPTHPFASEGLRHRRVVHRSRMQSHTVVFSPPPQRQYQRLGCRRVLAPTTPTTPPPHPVVLIWDRLKAHRARLIEEFVHDTRTIDPVLLAPYAPELNPIEYAWGYLKHNPLANHACLETDTLADTARHTSRSLQRQQPLLRSFILHALFTLPLKIGHSIMQ